MGSRSQRALPTSQKGSITSNGASLLSQAVPISEVIENYIKMVVYGENRVGKTTLACQWPKPLLLISMEPQGTGGALSVTKVAGVKTLRVLSTDHAVKLAVELMSDDYYKSVVLDSVTSLQDIVLKEIMNLPEIIDQLNWGMVGEDGYRERSEKTREVLRKFINLPKHVVFNAKERDHNKDKASRKPKMLRSAETESFFAADLGGATAGWLHDCCDYIGRLYIDKEYEERVIPGPMMKGVKGPDRVEYHETGRIVRRLRTLYHPNYAAGFRSCTPEKVPEFIQDPTFAKIKAIIDGD